MEATSARPVATDGPVSSDSASSSATIASSQRSASSHARRQPVTRQHSYTHVFPAESASERSSERAAALSKKNSTTSRAAMRELLHPSPSLDADARSKLLCNGLQWLLESSDSAHELNKSAVRPLSHDAVDAFNLEGKSHAAACEKSNKATRAGSQSTKTWIDEQRKVKPEKPW